jgi:hypothetical protein
MIAPTLDELLANRRTLAEVKRAAPGAAVDHDELGRGAIVEIAAGGAYAIVDFVSGQRFSVHIEDLQIVAAPGGGR